MTDLTDDQVRALEHAYRFAKDEHERTIARTATALLQARAENARLRADAKAAVAMVVEKAADSLLECCVWCDSQPRTDDGWRNGVRDARKHGMTAIRALAPVDGLAMVEALRTERDELKAQKWDVQHTDTMNDIVSLGMERDRLTADLAAAQAQIEALRGAPFPDETGFYGLIGDAMREAEKAMRKFPQPNYVISKVAEEAGEVVKAAIHCAEGRETAENLRGEMKQLIAMLYRLWVEGDGVHGLPSVRAALSAKDS